MLKCDGFDEAVLGVASRIGQPDVLAYDTQKVIDILMRDMPEEEAWEYFDFNMAGAFVGELTPIFIMIGSPSCIQELLEPQ